MQDRGREIKQGPTPLWCRTHASLNEVRAAASDSRCVKFLVGLTVGDVQRLRERG